MPDLSTVGKRLEFARSQKGLLQRDLAKALRMKNTTQISQWESDVYTPSAHRLEELAVALGTSSTWILSGNGIQPGENGSPAHRFPIAALMRTPAVRAWLNAFQAELIERGASPEEDASVMRAVMDPELLAKFAAEDARGQFTEAEIRRAMENIAATARRVLSVDSQQAKPAKKGDESAMMPALDPRTGKAKRAKRASGLG